ncbi:hypothetical protein GCM10025867_16300 [Frondihabitans sucicola]|uniref:Asl1-like glycosyl hydrolase catalytic domain-containing protein n=1 Tax=Frondihabitans sucicola TaxID=1268041 RepID=A0ABM8GLV0_9MICO|nr:hypothetical protein [Frondihabitans sucicola]BDZ49389.1 hypothetical protein GCM10025867_16300 [Frondihabitans sucicola]
MVYRDGATVGDTFAVTLLLWYGGMIYHSGTGGQFYVCANSQWLKVTDPRIPLSAPAGLLYGANGHHDTPQSPALVVSLLTGLGLSSYRVNCTEDPTSLTKVVALAEAMQGTGITLFPVIDKGLQDADGTLFATEDAAYASGYTTGAGVAAALTPYGVTMIECGNELTRNPAIILPGETADAGTKAADFDNQNWPLMRGLLRGMIDGVKSVQATAKVGVNFCKSDIGASDALWDGFQPDGSGGYPLVRWDITTWHNYEGDGDIFAIGTDGAGPSFNLPIYCKARYGTPFMMTEWNSDPNQPLSHRASYIPSQLAEFRAHRTTEAFQASMIYELDGGTEWGLVDDAGTPVQPPYQAFHDYVAANPDS